MLKHYIDQEPRPQDYNDLAPPAPLCLFRCTTSGFPKENIISIVEPNDNAFFSRYHKSITAILPYDTQVFLCRTLKDRNTHYVLLLSNDQRPILVVTAASEYGGLCLAVALPAKIESVLSYLRTIPRISILQDPAIATRNFSAFSFDPPVFEHLRQVFVHLFSFFEASFSEPMHYTDPIALFRLMKQKAESLATLFGLRSHFLIPYAFEMPIRTDTAINMTLFSAALLLLFSSITQNAAEKTIRIVFISLDGYPAACVHFRSFSELDTSVSPYSLLTRLFSKFGGYFKLSRGEEAQKAAEKIPGVGYMVRNERCLTFSEHILCALSPAMHDFTDFVNHSPIFHLPDAFYEGFM